MTMREMSATKTELRELMRAHGLRAEDVAALLDEDLESVYRWLGEEQPPMPGYKLALLRDRLARRALPPCTHPETPLTQGL